MEERGALEEAEVFDKKRGRRRRRRKNRASETEKWEMREMRARFMGKGEMRL